MKKLLLLALTAVMMAGCMESKANYNNKYISSKNAYLTVVDSCEYVLYDSYGGMAITHKGNCRYCQERRHKELKELIREIKEK